ncbi:hypothetical protein HX867_08055 [Pseudomonas gingeri]|uniref:hypothetical protein n=1 Tax=Pseudomonas gingeri TaxID=117681 RepID=UPI0015A34973|nr:hypothetical protein [Pseudomonas gingeri]NVZ62032.1 hypothetical protein [Pseudomonas gingeri]
MTHAQDTTQAQAALLRNDSGIAAPVTDSCCEAASIISPCSATTEGLIPHEKLREAATPKASLIALDRPPAQPVKGYTHPTPTAEIRAGGLRYWPADLTNVRPEEWAQMSPKHVAEFAGTTEVWLLLEAAQQRIAELEALQAKQQEALKFYAERSHYHFESGNWDTVSGEPLNILWNGDEPDFIEDGSVARAVLSASAEPSEQAYPTRHEQPHDLQASSLREAMEREAARGRPCALIVGDTRVQVSFHGIKWYHDHQKTGQRSESLTTEEFDQVVTKALGIEAVTA